MSNSKISFIASDNAALAELLCWYSIANEKPIDTYSISLNVKNGYASLHKWESNFSNITIYETELEHPCTTCAIREISTQWLGHNLPKNSYNLIILPENTALDYILPTLAQIPAFKPKNNQLTSCLYLCNKDQLKNNIFHPSTTLSKNENPNEKAQTILSNIRYADYISTPSGIRDKNSTLNNQLLKHLRQHSPNTHTQQISEIKLENLFHNPHNYSHNLNFLNPLNNSYNHDPNLKTPLWHENIHYDQMIHPDQLLEAAEKLAQLEIIGQGYFHLPTRGETCIWEFAAGSFSLGLAQETCHTGTNLTLTGVNQLEKPLVHEIIHEILIDYHSIFSSQWTVGKDCFAEIL